MHRAGSESDFRTYNIRDSFVTGVKPSGFRDDAEGKKAQASFGESIASSRCIGDVKIPIFACFSI